MKIGMQLYSMIELIKNDRFEEAMHTACAAGIDGLELYSLYDIPAMTYRKIMNEHGVVCCGTHNHLTPLRDDLDHVMEYNYVLGNKTIICHYLLEDERGSLDKYLQVAENLNAIGDKLRRNGFTLLYHNHDFEFREVFGGKCGMDLLLENTDPFLVGVELHIGQLPKFGLDIPAYIANLGGRVKVLHAHAFQEWGSAFDSKPGIEAAKAVNAAWAVLENVYPLEHANVADIAADVEATRRLARA